MCMYGWEQRSHKRGGNCRFIRVRLPVPVTELLRFIVCEAWADPICRRRASMRKKHNESIMCDLICTCDMCSC